METNGENDDNFVGNNYYLLLSFVLISKYKAAITFFVDCVLELITKFTYFQFFF